MSSLATGPSVGAAVIAGLLVLVIVGAGVAIVAMILRRLRHAAMASAVQGAVAAELERDPALGGLTLGVETLADWTGEIVVIVSGAVGSPWYRYAVIRAAQRGLSRTFRSARIEDRIFVDARSGAAAIPQRRSA